MACVARLPSPPPLVSIMILSCDRPAFLSLAIAAAATQDYPRLEVLVVDDGKLPVNLAPNSAPRAAGSFAVRHIRMKSRATIGAKRNAAVRSSRGAVIIHFDDDDFHPPNQVSALACPILENVTDLSALTFTHLARLGQHSLKFYEYKKWQRAPERVNGDIIRECTIHSYVACHPCSNLLPQRSSALSHTPPR